MKLNAKRVVFWAFLTLTFATSGMDAAAQDDRALALAKQILIVTKAEANFAQILPPISNSISDLLRKTNPGRGDQIASLVEEYVVPELRNRSSELVDLMAHLYARTFSLQEMTDILVFYESSAGKKLIEVLPQLILQSMAIGQAWGEKVGRDAMERVAPKLRERGLKAPI